MMALLHNAGGVDPVVGIKGERRVAQIERREKSRVFRLFVSSVSLLSRSSLESRVSTLSPRCRLDEVSSSSAAEKSRPSRQAEKTSLKKKGGTVGVSQLSRKFASSNKISRRSEEKKCFKSIVPLHSAHREGDLPVQGSVSDKRSGVIQDGLNATTQ
jgi:hypothetical protein